MRKEADILDGCQKVILNTYMQHAKEGVTPEQINALIDAETWKNGEEWQEYFDIEVSEESSIAASGSSYFDKYNNFPGKKEEKTMPDADSIAEAVAERLEKKFGKDFPGNHMPEENQVKNEISGILEDLDYCI